MPLVRLANRHHSVGTPDRVRPQRHRVGAQQRRTGADDLVVQRSVGGGHHRDVLSARGIADNSRVGHAKRVGHFPLAHRNHQCKILHHVVRLGRHRVHVHTAAHHRHGIICAQQGRNEDVFHVIDRIEIGQAVRIPRQVVANVRRNIVAKVHGAIIDVTGVQIGDDQVKIVDQLDGRGRIPRRIGPDQGGLQSQILRVGRRIQRHDKRVAVAGGQGVGRVLVHKEARTGRAKLIRQTARRHRALDVALPPALIIDRVGHGDAIITHRPAAVEQQRLHQRRTGRLCQPVGEVILNQRQQAGHLRRRHARAGFVAIVRRKLLVHAL